MFEQNPFMRRVSRRQDTILSDPDITVPMAAQFVRACDAHQLRLFAPLIFNGLRISEIVFVFGDQLRPGWLEIRRHPELLYAPKSHVGRETPILPVVEHVLRHRPTDGLVFLRRDAEASELPHWSRSKAMFVEEFNERCLRERAAKVADRLKIRDAMMRTARGLTTKVIEGQFRTIRRRLGWLSSATPHSFRHLFATVLEDANVPATYRKLLLGHAPDRSVTSIYTHAGRKRLREFYLQAIEQEMPMVLNAIESKARECGLIDDTSATEDERILPGPGSSGGRNSSGGTRS